MTKINLLETAIKIYQPISLKNSINIIRFVLLARKYKLEINRFVLRLNNLAIPVTSEMIGASAWPYIHNGWDVKKKLNTIASHYEILAKENPMLTRISTSSSFQVCNLDHLSNGLVIRIDYPKWFIREGELSINIFKNDLRVVTIAFTLGEYQGKTVAYIGVVQGIHSGIPGNESLEIFRSLTKEFHGLRPKSLLVEVLKVVTKRLGVQKLLGVKDQNRHHRHKYFGFDENTKFLKNYNIFWEEHGGILIDDIGMFQIPMAPAIRDVSKIASKKRSQYHKRNTIIESLEGLIKLS